LSKPGRASGPLRYDPAPPGPYVSSHKAINLSSQIGLQRLMIQRKQLFKS
jgi:hypothetical protein